MRRLLAVVVVLLTGVALANFVPVPAVQRVMGIAAWHFVEFTDGFMPVADHVADMA